ncbi:DNA methyltransferase [Dehalococcoides sp.]|uniref:DNA methyltransferase n=1 Tax=Dehalococcoides sp. TaxID=1966486 RepID=UPI002ACB0C98|nr:DNA methyltransferase [Dehalococcoides sp.]
MAEETNLLTVPEASEFLGHTVQHVRILIREGKLPGQKIGRDWMIPRDAVVEYNTRKSSISLFPDLDEIGKGQAPQLSFFEPKNTPNKYFFYFKDSKVIKPVESQELNEKARLKLQQIYEHRNGNIPDYFQKNWDRVALFNPSADVEKANAILINPEDGAYDLNNRLNDLTGKEWTKFTCSWFRFNALQSDLKEERAIAPDSKDHPATFSPTMIEGFVRFFTKQGQRVLDPFCGIGSTLVACKRSRRIGYGIELNKKYYEVSLKRVPEFRENIFNCNTEDLASLGLPEIDFSISSPPYWNMLNRSTRDFKKLRTESNLDYKYSGDDQDLGNITEYDEFLSRVSNIYLSMYDLLKQGGYLIIIVKNVKKGGKLYPLAWDLARALSKRYVLKDEKIWIQDEIGLAPYGYPFSWVSNILHHYCLIVRKETQ